MVFACALSPAIKEIGFASYIVRVTEGLLTGRMVPLTAFAIACITAFATGTSAGTVAVVAPLALALAQNLDAHLILTVAAVLGGSMWGDTTSPISDLAVKPAIGAASDIMDMISCQTPYKLCFLAVSVVGFGLLSFIL